MESSLSVSALCWNFIDEKAKQFNREWEKFLNKNKVKLKKFKRSHSLISFSFILRAAFPISNKIDFVIINLAFLAFFPFAAVSLQTITQFQAQSTASVGKMMGIYSKILFFEIFRSFFSGMEMKKFFLVSP